MSKWPMVPLGEVLQLQRRWVKVDPLTTYEEIGVRCFGNGIFHKAPIDGSTLGNKRVLRIEPGDLVFNNVFAWEGAVAVASESEAGKIGSHRFVTYTTDKSRCSADYLRWFFKSEPGLEVLRRVSPGSAGRNRTLSLNQLPMQEIPLPSPGEQQHLVAYLDTLRAKTDEAIQLRQEVSLERRFFSESWLRTLFPEPKDTKVGDFVKFQTGYAFKSEWFVSEGIKLARNVNVGHGTLNWAESVYIPEPQAKEFPRFVLNEGDILISLDRPIISTGVKAAQVRASDLPALLLQRVARAEFVSTEVLPDYFFIWLTSPWFTGAIDPGRSNGVPHISHKDIERIPFSPPSIEEQLNVVAWANEMMAKKEEADSLAATLRLELYAMIPAILDQVFNGEL